jgi:hypothetical protein
MGTSEPQPTQTASEPQPTQTLNLSSAEPSRLPAEAGDQLSGVLGADAVEGGCGYLRASDGTRYEVIYPDGWRLRLSPLQLVAPDGTVVARAGDLVTVRGAEATDILSICQIGPIFRASEVLSPP